MRRDALPAPTGPFAPPGHWLAGAHLARVTDVNDPEGRARVKVELYATDTAADVALWARVAAPFAGANRGAFLLPQPDDEVLVVFAGGDARAPVVVGGLWNGAATPPESLSGRVDRWSFTGKAGTRIAIVEESDATARIELVTPGGASLKITDEAGGKFELRCAGNTITVDSSGVSVQAAAKVAVTAPKVDVSAPTVNVDAALSKFSGIVKSDVVQTNVVISSSYTPGAGNVW